LLLIVVLYAVHSYVIHSTKTDLLQIFLNAIFVWPVLKITIIRLMENIV